MLYIALCDNDNIELEHISRMLEELSSGMDLACQVRAFDSGEDLLGFSKEFCPFHLVIMNVRVDRERGIETAMQMRRNQYHGYLVFYSDSSHQALASYMVKAYDYLLQPVTPGALGSVLRAVCRELNAKSGPLLSIYMKNGVYMIRHQDIMFLESSNHKLILYYRNGEVIRFTGKLDEFSRQFQSAGLRRFIRCHKSYLVNSDFILKIETDSFLLKNGRRIPISRSCKSEAFADFMNYCSFYPQLPGR